MVCDVFNAYIKPRSSPVRLHLTQKMIADMDQFIQGNKVSALSCSCMVSSLVVARSWRKCIHWAEDGWIS